MEINLTVYISLYKYLGAGAGAILCGPKAVIDKMQDKLKDHWMFSGNNTHRLNALLQCDSCRIETAANEGFDPYAAKPRPNVITSEDYIDANATKH